MNLFSFLWYDSTSVEVNGMKIRDKKKKKSKKEKNFIQSFKDKFQKRKKSSNKKRDIDSFSIKEVILIILISILFGIIIGYMITYSKNPIYNPSSKSHLSDVVDTYQGIVDNYYGEIDEEELSKSAIRAMVSSLEDPYSFYMDKDVSAEFNEQNDGAFVGIGVVIVFTEQYNQIVSIYDDSPASKAGLEVDDYIIAVNGEDVLGKTGDELSKLIRGEKGTEVSVTVRRGEEEKTYTLKRDVVELSSVYSATFDDIGYLRIDSFAANTYEQFQKELLNLEKENISGLVIDVRDNYGGHLLQTKQILSLFFPKKTVLYQIESNEKKTKIYSDTKEKREYPIAVLVNGGSASASEILASSIQENYKNSYIVGNTTYGKGTVQFTKKLSDGSSIKYTTEKWLTAKGTWLDGKGVTPDSVVNLDETYMENPTYENDNQLQEALRLIKES